MLGMPVVGLATTEMATAVSNGEAGFVDTSLERLIPRMKMLLDNPAEARRLGENARCYARQRFSIERFVSDWNVVLAEVTQESLPSDLERNCDAATCCANQ